MMKSFNSVNVNMKALSKIAIALLGFSVVLMIGCTDSAPSNKFSVSADDPATGITFGWYVPDSTLQDLIGPYFSPKIVNEKGEGLLMFFVVKADNHGIGGEKSGKLTMAQLLVPVIRMSGLNENDGYKIENTIVSPLTILAESKPLYSKLDELGFALVRGEIDFSIEESDDKIEVGSTITTQVGKTILKAWFEKLPVDSKSVTAVINPGSSKLKYFHGEESAQRFENGRGLVKSEGNTFYSGLNLENRPYFITLDKAFTWDFYFEGN